MGVNQTSEFVEYMALLRGINVGGNNIIKMSELRDCMAGLGFTNVRTYIQSGNILFNADEAKPERLEKHIQKAIASQFLIDLNVVVVSKNKLQKIVDNAPVWWGEDDNWKHNLIFLVRPFVLADVVAAIGELKPGIERIGTGDAVIYQSISKDSFSKTTSSKLASKSIYKKMTIRNFNTANKLLEK